MTLSTDYRCIWLSVLFSAIAGGTAHAEDGQSLFDEPTYRSLVAESKALRVGDVLTVIVQEAASAASSADLRARREFSLSADLDATRVTPHSANLDTATRSDGAGATQRSGRLLAQLSVRVVDVTANGDLQVSGQQSLRINGEKQIITLSGIVRTRDIGENNTVMSNRIADARIQFEGEGFVTDQSRPGWLARLFDFLGL
jgi:flagellar L-ring protein precursor FlgH